MTSTTSNPIVRSRTLNPPIALIGLLIAWIGCYFPWTLARGAAFTVNLFDLAEWTTLDATVRYGSSPALVPSFLLRLTIGLIGLALVFQAIRLSSITTRRLLILLALAITIGLLPPFGHLKDVLIDANYRQQFILAVVGSVFVIVIWLFAARLPSRVLFYATIVVPLIILLCGAIGWLTAINALNAFQIHLTVNSGLFIFAVGLLLALFVRLFSTSDYRQP